MSIEILRNERAQCNDKLRVVMLAPSEADDALAEYDALVERLWNFTAPDDPCSLDHNGYCQAHSWFNTEPKCPHARAKEVLAPKENK